MSNGLSKIKNEDFAILERIKQAEETALAELYDQYSPVLYGIAMRVLRSISDAEDILQDVFLQLWNKPDSYQSFGISIGSWLVINTRSRAVAKMLSKGVRHQPHQIDLNNITFFSAEHLPQNEFQSKVIDAFKKITPDQQRILTLICHEGFTIDDVAQILKVTTEQVHKRITEGLRIL
ncbi:MAG: sigma-70 family RNA polymerase sigma factor [Bacteroidota bacterium]|nr:sigma-70 family RNA polymerase sigma factor [Bacteroidota bacterium]